MLSLDLKDFFPMLEYKRIRGAFRGLAYGEAAATIYALLTSEPEVDKVELVGQTSNGANGARRLPQGAPTSPAITNVVCRRMDARLVGAAAKLGFLHALRRRPHLQRSQDRRYGRDAGPGSVHHRSRELRRAPKTTRVLRRGRRQEVTSVLVNQ